MWTNVAGGLWSDRTNWSPNALPSSADDVLITVAGTYTVTQNVGVAVASLAIGGGSGQQTLVCPGVGIVLGNASVIGTNAVLQCAGSTFDGPGQVTVLGRMECSAGALNALAIGTGGRLIFSGDGDKGLRSGLINAGTITWSGIGNLILAGSRIENQSGAVFEIQTDAGLFYFPGPGAVTNSGTIRKTAGTKLTVFGNPLFNSGTIEVQSGGILYADGTVFNGGSKLLGNGTNLLGGGTITLLNDITSENLHWAGAGLAGTSTLHGRLKWTGGPLLEGARLTNAPDGVLSVEGDGQKGGIAGLLVNEGAITWSGAGQLVMSGGRIENRLGASFEIQTDAGMTFFPGPGTIVNAGLIRKSAGSGIMAIFNPVANVGTLEAQVGAISYAGGSTFESGSRFIGSGTNLLAGGTVTLTGEISSENLRWSGVALAGAARIHGSWAWTGGPLLPQAILTNAVDGNLHILGEGDKGGLTGTLVNEGVMAWTGPGRLVLAGGTIENHPGATFDIQTDACLCFFPGVGTIVNDGLLRKTDASGLSVFTSPILNRGTLAVESGGLSYSGGSVFYPGSRFTGRGTNLVAGDTVTIVGEIQSENLLWAGATLTGTNTVHGTWGWTAGALAAGAIVTNAPDAILRIEGATDKGLVAGLLVNEGAVTWTGSGRLVLAGGRIDNRPSGLFDLQNDSCLCYFPGPGSLSNSGILRRSVATNAIVITNHLTNSGTMDLQTGVLTMASDLVSTGGQLNFVLNGPTNFGRLNFTGAATLAGVLKLTLGGEFRPKANDSFHLITYPAASGQFTRLELPPEAAWQTNALMYEPRGLVLTVLNARPALQALAPLTVDEENRVSFTANAADPDLDQQLTFTVAPQPLGSLFDPALGVFTWTPGESQGPSTNWFTLLVTDNGAPRLSATQEVVIVVRELNRPPVLPAPAALTINELQALRVANTATDPDLPANALTYTLVKAPPSAMIDQDGVITWTPSEAQGPSTNVFATVASDSNPWASNSSRLSTTNEFTVVVKELNSAPQLNTLADYTVNPGQAISFSANATDADIPVNPLAFSLLSAPAGASVDSGTGFFSWRVPLAFADSTNVVRLQVMDDNPDAADTPHLADAKSFAVTVNPLAPVLLTNLLVTPTQTLFSVVGSVGPDYTAWVTTNLSTWTSLCVTSPVASTFSVIDTNGGALGHRFYRVTLGP